MIHEIITDVLKAEGWDAYTNHPADRGGPTKWGITLSAWRDFNDNQTLTAFNVQGITEAEARVFYHRRYIVDPKFDKIKSPYLMGLVIDSGVNHGTKVAAKWLQRALDVQQDGILGPITLTAVNAHDDIVVALKYLSYRVKLYGHLVTRDPSQAVFSKGWNARAAKWMERLAEHYIGG